MADTTALDAMGRYSAANVTCQGCVAVAQRRKGEEAPGLHTHVIDKRRGGGSSVR